MELSLKHSLFTIYEPFWWKIWFLIYGGFLTMDLIIPNFFGATVLRVFGICGCAFYVWWKAKDDQWLVLAMSATLLSDILLIINPASASGVAAFCFTQFFHLVRLFVISPMTLPILIFEAILVFLLIVNQVSLIYIISFIYGVLLLSNLYFAWRRQMRGPEDPQLRATKWGFLLFICCDFCVAISFLSGVAMVLPLALHQIANYLAWAFYFPSQVLIAGGAEKKLV